MSLAATLTASGMRPASFLPAIKCSSCGEEIEIARMGEHICGPPLQQSRTAPAALSNPYSPPQWTAPQQHKASSPLQHAYSPSDAMVRSPVLAPLATGSQRNNNKHPMPPRINPDAANRPFLAPSYPRSASPASPVLSIRSGRSGSSNGSRPPMLRTMTMPTSLRDRSPSPEMASNLDCAFPSFPTSSSRPGTSNGRKTPTPSERAPSRSGLRSGQEAFAEEPRSPRTTGGEYVMKRANTLRSGPFDAGRRKASREEKSVPAPPLSFALPVTMPRREPSPDRIQPLSPRKSSLPQDLPLMHDYPKDSREDFLSNVPAPLRIAERSNTFPLPPGNEHEVPRSPGFQRRPSEPVVRGRERRPSIAASMRSESRPRQLDPTVRPQSRNGPRTDPRMQDAPPVPKPVQQYRQTSTHAPSESASSASSLSPSYSHTNSSEGPSPISSAASSVDLFSAISQGSAYEGDERPKSIGRSAGYSTKSQQQNPGLRAEQPAKRASPPNFARPRPHTGAMTQAPLQPVNQLVDSPPEIARDQWPGDSSAHPAQAWSALSIPNNEYDPYKPPSPNPAMRSRSKSNASEYSFYEPDPISSVPLPPMPTAPLRPLQRRNTSAKATCRGCNLVIEGKSVKAADGRLTGRWHKHCFTCRTCSQPFATADFYVINDQPYCKQHYHEKNGSICSGCQRGIEGQYLETSNQNAPGAPRQKFHPTCFTCCECRIILSNDYFEINGKPYCERHAYAAKRGVAPLGSTSNRGAGSLYPPSSRRELTAERRTTKLMMM